MKLKVEFLGLARELAGDAEAVVTVDDRATWHDLISALADAYPSFVGPIVLPDRSNLTAAYMLNVGGRAIVRDLDVPVQPGQRLLLMFAEAGG
ncbi:MAG: MoaD/ThiS family protein [Chloroflexi bacterium]|nr:MoaD/ThiS family protein [Chloroflexota bacterium]